MTDASQPQSSHPAKDTPNAKAMRLEWRKNYSSCWTQTLQQVFVLKCVPTSITEYMKDKTEEACLTMKNIIIIKKIIKNML